MDPKYYVEEPFVPEWCLGGDHCVEMLAVHPSFAYGATAQIVRNNRFNITLAYVGTNITALVLERVDRNIPVLFRTSHPFCLAP